MRRKDLKIGTEYLMSRRSRWETDSSGALRVRVIDLGYWRNPDSYWSAGTTEVVDEVTGKAHLTRAYRDKGLPDTAVRRGYSHLVVLPLSGVAAPGQVYVVPPSYIKGEWEEAWAVISKESAREADAYAEERKERQHRAGRANLLVSKVVAMGLTSAFHSELSPEPESRSVTFSLEEAEKLVEMAKLGAETAEKESWGS